MADFYVGLTGSVQLDDVRINEELKTQFILAYRQANVMDALAEWNYEAQAKSVSFARYPQLAGGTTPLNEREEVDSEQMSDSGVSFTPAEYGNVVSLTNLAVLQSGGRDAMAAMQLIGQDMASTRNKQAIATLEGSSNVTYSDGGADGTAITAGDVASPTLLNKMYNKLARANVPKHTATGTYVAVMHDDVIHDLREGSSAGSWEDVNKYNNEMPVLMNEVGMFKGFRIIRNNDCAIEADGGASAVDLYKSSFIGFNAFGLAESQRPEIRITGPFDKLGRFVNVGWYGVYKFGLIEPASTQVLVSASSVGDNA